MNCTEIILPKTVNKLNKKTKQTKNETKQKNCSEALYIGKNMPASRLTHISRKEFHISETNLLCNI